MHLLVLTHRPDGAKSLLPSLEYLPHTVVHLPLSTASLDQLVSADVLMIDATADLREAAACVRTGSVHDARRGIVVIASEGTLAALQVGWGFDEWMLPSAGPAEIEARLRLAGTSVEASSNTPSARVGDLEVNEDSYQVRLRGRPLDLTFKEFELLKTLANSPNRVYTREMLLSEVWGYDYFGGSRTVDVHVRRLRAKLGPEYEHLIVTVRGVGYKLVPDGRAGRDATD